MKLGSLHKVTGKTHTNIDVGDIILCFATQDSEAYKGTLFKGVHMNSGTKSVFSSNYTEKICK